MENISKKFGEKVREVRLKQGLSQGDVARRLNLHRSYVSGIERGVRNPSLKVVQKIAKALEVEVNNLLK
jgi:transcriptional regulator with XRE-family HTH domain